MRVFLILNLVYLISFDSTISVYSLFFGLFYLNNTIHSLYTSNYAMLLNDTTLNYWIVLVVIL